MLQSLDGTLRLLDAADSTLTSASNEFGDCRISVILAPENLNVGITSL